MAPEGNKEMVGVELKQFREVGGARPPRAV